MSRLPRVVARRLWAPLLCLSARALMGAEVFHLPTANRALYEVGAMERYFAPTPGRSWESGTFGCVRNEGGRLHEGIDIKAVERDKKGEATDPVMASAVRHAIEGLEIYSLYAHLSQIRSGLAAGQKVRAGEMIAILGRTANTRETITQDRAHLHFEINLLVNERFPSWFKQANPGERNDHGLWNGQNLLGLDPRLILLQQRRGHFSLLDFIRAQTELCRVWVRKPELSFARRYPPLVRANSRAETEGLAGYELALNYNGLPIQLIPRSASETKHLGRTALLSVNAAEQRKNPCRRLAEQQNGHWVLDQNGAKLLDLLAY
jgi:murein DD-endopeptidase MepM/ murein hydrolase activator NlpD